MLATSKKMCCRSSPRCARCPVLAVRARRLARARPTAPATLFDEIYGARSAELPDSVAEALAALSLARRPRRAGVRGAAGP